MIPVAWEKICNKIKYLAGIRSAQGASFVMTAAGLVGKPFGYIRVLIVAWMFGTSAGIDAFYLASGIISLVVSTSTTAMESAVLPELALLREREGEAAARNLMAFTCWCLLAVCILYLLVVLLFPRQLIALFAGGFDEERLNMGVKMLYWLIPFVVATACRFMLEIWATFNARYTLSSLCSIVFNFVAIPVMLLSIASLREYSVAFSMGLGHLAITLLLLFFLGGVPVKVRAVPWQSVRVVAKNTLFCLGIVGSQGLYMVVDRYFASLLPTGSVAAISYAGYVFGLLLAAASPPLWVFLAKACDLMAEDVRLAEEYLQKALAVAFCYFIPVGLFLAALARPIVTVSFGWGKFGLEAVEATSICLAAYGVGLPFSIAAIVLYRFGQAKQQLGRIVLVTYSLVACNALLNWMFSKWWGVGGLAAATTCVQVMFSLYLGWLLVRNPGKLMAEARLFRQCVLASLCALLMFGVSAYAGALPGLLAASVIAWGYFIGADRLGYMDALPENWRPVFLFRRLGGMLGLKLR